jgi:hypothetical protein
MGYLAALTLLIKNEKKYPSFIYQNTLFATQPPDITAAFHP